MTVDYGPTPPQPSDRSGAQAQQDFADDVRALNHLHTILEWTIDVTDGSLMAMCRCTGLVYSTTGDHHWRQEVRRARGLNKLPKPKR